MNDPGTAAADDRDPIDAGHRDPPSGAPAPGPPTGHVDEITEVEAEAEAGAPGPLDLHEDVLGIGAPPNPRAGRQRYLVRYLRVALAVAVVVAVVELLLPAERQDDAGTVMVAVLVAAPIGRVLWLVVRWLRLGDRRFAAVGLVLLAVVGTGLLIR